jgi:hypothetical protein
MRDFACARFGKAAGLVVLVLCLPGNILPVKTAFAAGTPMQPKAAPSDIETAGRLLNLFQAQKADGDFEFERGDRLFDEYPVMATITKALNEKVGDESFLAGAYASLSRYYDYLFIERDRDGDYLVESPSREPGAADRLVEDPGYNSLLALDLLNFAEICIATGHPVDALYRRRQAKTVIARVVAETFSMDSRFFFPYDDSEGRQEHLYYAASLLPCIFAESIGENNATFILKQYLLKPQYLSPEQPYRLITGASLKKEPSQEKLLQALLLLSILHRYGFDDDVKSYGDDLRSIVGKGAASPRQASPYLPFLAACLDDGGYTRFIPRIGALRVLSALVASKNALSQKEATDLEEAARTIGGILEAGPQGEAPGHEAAGQDEADLGSRIRSVYFAVSRIRRQLSEGSARTIWRDRSILGFKVRPAVAGLLDEVVLELKEAENIIFARDGGERGMELSCIALNGKLVPGERLRLRVSLRTLKDTLRIRAVDLSCNSYRRVLFSSRSGAALAPGDTTMTFASELPLGNDMKRGLRVVNVSIGVSGEGGWRIQRNYPVGVFLAAPLEFSLSFPEGRTLRGASLPLKLTFVKNTRYGLRINTSFFSPSGLNTREGRYLQYDMPAGSDSTELVLHVLKPEPCRPGSFPFSIKIFANGDDIGTAGGWFFKHYQWVFIGPFPGSDLAVVYPPERRVNLLERIHAGKRSVSWTDLPAHAYGDGGEIDLSRLMQDGGIGYLHTVIKSSVEKSTAVYMSSTVPATLFINSRIVMQVQKTGEGLVERSQIHLRKGLNNILIKVVARRSTRLFFKLGNDDELTSDEFNNNLWELVEGYQEFHMRSRELDGEQGETSKVVTLVYVDGDAHSVSVIGSFNGWSPDNSALRKVSANRWEITLHLPPGRYPYRFLVNNQVQILDPRCPYQESDGYGGRNSVLFVE